MKYNCIITNDGFLGKIKKNTRVRKIRQIGLGLTLIEDEEGKQDQVCFDEIYNIETGELA